MLKYIYIILSAIGAVALCLITEAFAGLSWLWLLPAGFVGSFLALLVLLFALVLIMTALVDMEKPETKDSGFYRAVIHGIISLGIPLLLVRLHEEGLEKKIPGKCLVVCNHLHELDPVFLLRAFKEKRLAFISKREVTDMFIVGKFLHKIRGQFINRENDREALKTILNCIRIIKEDDASVAVFPEGYCSNDKKLHPLRSGVFKIALKTKAPIVVCTLQNTHLILKNAMKLKPTDVHMHLVGVIPAEELESLTAVEVGNRVHKMMADDLGPDLVLQVEE